MGKKFSTIFYEDHIKPAAEKHREEFNLLLAANKESFSNGLKGAFEEFAASLKTAQAENTAGAVYYIGLHYLFMTYFMKNPRQFLFRAYGKMLIETPYLVERSFGYDWFYPPIREFEGAVAGFVRQFQLRGASVKDTNTSVTRELEYCYTTLIQPLVQEIMTKEYIQTTLEGVSRGEALEILYCPYIASLNENMDVFALYPKEKKNDFTYMEGM